MCYQCSACRYQPMLRYGAWAWLDDIVNGALAEIFAMELLNRAQVGVEDAINSLAEWVQA